MRHKPHDKRHKALLEVFFELWVSVQCEREVTGQQQYIDLVVDHGPGDGSHDLGLPLLRRMSAERPCLFEVFYNTPGPSEIQACIRKQLGYHHELELRARRCRYPRPAIPPLWILSSGCPGTVLREYHARAMEGWPPGFWQTRPVDAMRLVVINKLPSIDDTLILRLLGRGPTLRQAIRELRDLPPDRIEHQRAMPVLLAYRDSLMDDLPEEDIMTPLQELRARYDRMQENARREGERSGVRRGKREGKRQGKRQGMRALLLRQLETRFVELPVQYVKRVKRADDVQLEVWGERILGADSLDEIFV